MLQRLGTFVGSFLLAAENKRDAAFGSELDHHVRALVGHPDVVVLVDFHGVGKGPSVKMMAHLADEFSVWGKLEQLRRGGTVGWSGGAAARKYKNVPFGIDRDSRGFAKIKIRRKLQKIRDGLEADFRRLLLGKRGRDK